MVSTFGAGARPQQRPEGNVSISNTLAGPAAPHPSPLTSSQETSEHSHKERAQATGERVSPPARQQPPHGAGSAPALPAAPQLPTVIAGSGEPAATVRSAHQACGRFATHTCLQQPEQGAPAAALPHLPSVPPPGAAPPVPPPAATMIGAEQPPPLMAPRAAEPLPRLQDAATGTDRPATAAPVTLPPPPALAAVGDAGAVLGQPPEQLQQAAQPVAPVLGLLAPLSALLGTSPQAAAGAAPAEGTARPAVAAPLALPPPPAPATIGDAGAALVQVSEQQQRPAQPAAPILGPPAPPLTPPSAPPQASAGASAAEGAARPPAEAEMQGSKKRPSRPDVD